MLQLLSSLLTLLFFLSGPVLKGNVEIWHSPLAAETAPGKFSVGIYDEIRGTVPGMDAHHVGQKAVMGDLIPGYDPATAPSILVPKVGHTRIGPNGRLSTSTAGFTSARDVIARDIRELRIQNSGSDWVAIYDGLGRREQTTFTLVVSNSPIVSPSSAVSVVASFYDPQVEFLEIGVTVNGYRTWKVHGPDLNETYGALNGVGGLDVFTYGWPFNNFGLVADYFGNVLGSISGTQITWSPARVSSYGPVPGYQSRSLSLNASLGEATVWRGGRVDETGLIYLGARYYEPTAGRFLSSDPLGHSASMDLYSAFHGDGVNNFDADGRLAKRALDDTAFRVAEKARYDETPAWTHPISSVVGLVQVGFENLNGFISWAENQMNTGQGSLAVVPFMAPVRRVSGLATISSEITSSERVVANVASEGAAAKATQLEFNFAKDFGQNSGLVLGRGRDLAMPGALGPGEYKLGWFSVQETSGMEAEWAVNQSKLQNVMNLNLPIRDASSLQNVGGFYLNNERGLLQSAGWNYKGGYWVPPAH